MKPYARHGNMGTDRRKSGLRGSKRLLAADGCPHGAGGVVGLFERGIPERDDGISHILVEGTAFPKNFFRYDRKIRVHESGEARRIHRLG